MSMEAEGSSTLVMSKEVADSSNLIMIDAPHGQSTHNQSQTDNATIETNDDLSIGGHHNQGGHAPDAFKVKKRSRTSTVWDDFTEVVVCGKKKAECIHCHLQMTITASKTTTSFKRHRDKCLIRKMKLKRAEQQTKINFQPVDSTSPSIPLLHDGKFDMDKMRERAAHWIMMHEHPFTILEEEGFNLMQKSGMPEWQKISRTMGKADCVAVHDIEKKKLKNLLKGVDKISITTDLWKSKNQKIEYMVVTGHWVDVSWKLQKRVLSFVHVPPPRRGVEIADAIFKCLKEWGIENKVYTISVDNASNNDAAIRILKENFSRSKNLICGGKLFHVRCCAHILNLMVQDGLGEIGDIVENIRDSVDYVNRTDARLLLFAEIVQQLQLPGRKLIHDCRTRWNSTFEMLNCAVKFKDVFPRLQDRELHYDCCPSSQDWDKVEKICLILESFWAATQIISGSDYPTSNLFLQQVQKIKLVLDKRQDDEDDFIQAMVLKMKLKFDKYWGECNLLMAIAAILDPRLKLRFVEFCFPKLYTSYEAKENVEKVKKAAFDIFDEYMATNIANEFENRMEIQSGGSCSKDQQTNDSLMNEFSNYCEEIETFEPLKSELVDYLEKPCFKAVQNAKSDELDCLEWWKSNRMTYPILSKMARDILAIPISTVASESTFSAGTRVIDAYRSSLSPDTVQVLMCGGDWCRHLHGVKKKIKKVKPVKEIALPIS